MVIIIRAIILIRLDAHPISLTVKSKIFFTTLVRKIIIPMANIIKFLNLLKCHM